MNKLILLTKPILLNFNQYTSRKNCIYKTYFKNHISRFSSFHSWKNIKINIKRIWIKKEIKTMLVHKSPLNVRHHACSRFFEKFAFCLHQWDVFECLNFFSRRFHKTQEYLIKRMKEVHNLNQYRLIMNSAH